MDAAAAPIEIRVESAAQLLHTLDPVPFRERDLDREAEEFIVSWARELPTSKPIQIIIHLPAVEAEGELGKGLGEILNRYFMHRSEIVTGELRELFRTGRQSLFIGLCVLAICMAGARFLASTLGNNEVAYFVREGLFILGWVANWRPIEIFLYDWWPLLRKRRLYRRLAEAKTSLQRL